MLFQNAMTYNPVSRLPCLAQRCALPGTDIAHARALLGTERATVWYHEY